VTVRRSPREVLEFVIDFERYRQVDHKIAAIRASERRGNEGVVTIRGRIRGVPAAVDRLAYRLVPYSRLELRSVPSLWPGLAVRFEGDFSCEVEADGTLVSHRECFAFRRPFRWLLEPLLGPWLARDTEAEMIRLRRALEGEA
jgi:polyketide cyclase/dehydrase/lipid transport protein